LSENVVIHPVGAACGGPDKASSNLVVERPGKPPVTIADPLLLLDALQKAMKEPGSGYEQWADAVRPLLSGENITTTEAVTIAYSISGWAQRLAARYFPTFG
jgi:hypothetical protein